MAWKVEFTIEARKSLEKLDKPIQERIRRFFKRLVNHENPRKLGKALTGNLDVYWSYRVGDYRAICSIHDNILTVEVIRIGHRREIYKL